ncbi:hypothetical protein TNCV_2289241 [Trichonephila clavipes]|uniref:Uncharacterized protein n=1 Tax=Trichonephila clavipes TaxID=2585209 RepID=A0A8X6RNW9_TRICX|nr:hypothetical protein TNCV_2289241 [Trichonephila clavipes]
MTFWDPLVWRGCLRGLPNLRPCQNGWRPPTNAHAWLLDHLTPSLPVPTDDDIRRIFIESSALDLMNTRLMSSSARRQMVKKPSTGRWINK